MKKATTQRKKTNTIAQKSIQIVTQNQVAFDLKDGTRLLLHKEDYQNIITKISLDVIIQMMSDCPERVFIGGKKHNNDEQVRSLYAILKEQNETISQEIKEDYLKTI